MKKKFINMRKLFVLLGLIFSVSNITSQQLYTNNGVTTFDGSKESFEPISAVNDKSVSVIDVNKGNIAALIYIKDFEFRLGLMQEHFNENYMDSGKYPKSTFSGVILNFDDKKLENKWIASRHQLSNIDLDTINEELNAVWEGPGSLAKIKAYTLESRAARLGQMIETQPKNKKATPVPTLDSNLKITD